MAKRVLIVGSGPNAVDCRSWDLSGFSAIVAINNAWRVRPDWTHLIHPEDFPPERAPGHLGPGQSIITAEEYIPCQNAFGGIVYAGGTMAFTAGYWALSALQPDVLAFLGCDMVYPEVGKTHFYGTGTADPLRADITLQDLGAKSARLMLLGAAAGCHCVNLSSAPVSKLSFPRCEPEALADLRNPPRIGTLPETRAALSREANLGYSVPSGRYWEVEDRFDPVALAEIDRLWLAAKAAHDRALEGCTV